MKFRFCGDADCPDWVLAEMTSLSRLTSVKLKILSSLVADGLINPPINMEKSAKLFSESKDPSEVQRCISCLTFILRTSARSNCDSAALGGELQQLGLPREHSQALKRVFIDFHDKISDVLKKESLRVNKLTSVNFRPLPNFNSIQIELNIDKNDKRTVILSRKLFNNMIKDLKNNMINMEDIENYAL